MKIVAAPAVVGVVVPTVREQFTYSDRRAKQGFVSWPGSIVSAGIEGPSIQETSPWSPYALSYTANYLVENPQYL